MHKAHSALIRERSVIKYLFLDAFIFMISFLRVSTVHKKLETKIDNFFAAKPLHTTQNKKRFEKSKKKTIFQNEKRGQLKICNSLWKINFFLFWYCPKQSKTLKRNHPHFYSRDIIDGLSYSRKNYRSAQCGCVQLCYLSQVV